MSPSAPASRPSRAAHTASYYPARLVWLLSFLALYTTAIMVVIVWWTLVDVRTGQEQADLLRQELQQTRSRFLSRLEADKRRILSLAAGKPAPSPDSDVDLLDLARRFEDLLPSGSRDALLERLLTQVGQLAGLETRLRQRHTEGGGASAAWLQEMAGEAARLTAAVRSTSEQLANRIDERIEEQNLSGESAVRRALQIILIVGTATAVIFLAISYRVVQEIQGQIQAIEQTNIMLDARTRALTASEEALRRSEEQLQTLSSNLLTAQEQERQRIARELHDELGQAMAALKMQVGAIERHLPTTPPERIQKECQEVREFINGIIESVRRLSRDLSPVVIDDLGLEAAIDYLANSFAKYQQIPITLDLDDLDPAFSKESQRLIYRIMQEALTNISRHAGAKQIYIAAERHGETVTFVIQDDGHGFDVEAVLSRRGTDRGMGLATMAERVRILGGTIQIDSTPGQGTTVAFTVPLHPEDAGDKERRQDADA